MQLDIDIAYTIIAFLIFFLGIVLLRYFAQRKVENNSYKPAVYIYIIWFIISFIGLGYINSTLSSLYFSVSNPFRVALINIQSIITIIIELFIISSLVMYFYHITFEDSIFITIQVMSIQILMRIIVAYILAMIFNLTYGGSIYFYIFQYWWKNEVKIMDLIIILFDVILIVMIIVLKSYFLIWLANKKNWENDLQKSFIVNIYWSLIMVGISVLLIFNVPLLYIAMNINYLQVPVLSTFFNLVFFALNFIIGYVLISHFYKGSHIDSFVISLILLITEMAFIKVIQSIVILIFGLNFGISDGIYIFSSY